jgi:hypothetical protein
LGQGDLGFESRRRFRRIEKEEEQVLTDFELCCSWLESIAEQNYFIPQLKGHMLTPKFGKESDLWVQLVQESVSRKGRILQIYSAKKSAVGYLLPFGKGTVELILRDSNDDVAQAGKTNGWMGDQA